MKWCRYIQEGLSVSLFRIFVREKTANFAIGSWKQFERAKAQKVGCQEQKTFFYVARENSIFLILNGWHFCILPHNRRLENKDEWMQMVFNCYPYLSTFIWVFFVIVWLSFIWFRFCLLFFSLLYLPQHLYLSILCYCMAEFHLISILFNFFQFRILIISQNYGKFETVYLQSVFEIVTM